MSYIYPQERPYNGGLEGLTRQFLKLTHSRHVPRADHGNQSLTQTPDGQQAPLSLLIFNSQDLYVRYKCALIFGTCTKEAHSGSGS